jgi:hypothetical protein
VASPVQVGGAFFLPRFARAADASTVIAKPSKPQHKEHPMSDDSAPAETIELLPQINWGTEQRKVSDLVPHPNNPRQMTEKQVADLTASLTRFNLAELPVVNTDNMILAGHQRLRILAMLGRGDELIDVRVPHRELSRAECDEYLIRSNKNTGGWDFDRLASFDEDLLQQWGFLGEELGFDTNLDEFFDDKPEEEESDDDAEEASTIVLEYTAADYARVKEALDAREGSYEAVVAELLGLDL